MTLRDEVLEQEIRAGFNLSHKDEVFYSDSGPAKVTGMGGPGYYIRQDGKARACLIGEYPEQVRQRIQARRQMQGRAFEPFQVSTDHEGDSMTGVPIVNPDHTLSATSAPPGSRVPPPPPELPIDMQPDENKPEPTAEPIRGDIDPETPDGQAAIARMVHRDAAMRAPVQVDPMNPQTVERVPVALPVVQPAPVPEPIKGDPCPVCGAAGDEQCRENNRFCKRHPERV